MFNSKTTLIFLIAFTSLASATQHLQNRDNIAGYNTSDIGPANANCQRKTYDITVTSNNTVFETVPEPNEIELAAYLQIWAGSFPAGSNFTEMYTKGHKEVTGTYSISGTWCTPKESPVDHGVVQLLVHGISFDSSYWHFTGTGIPSNQSYVEWAAAAGYNTFRYDRLGTGLSEHPQDAYNVVQAATDIAILEKITSLISSGKIGDHKGVKIVAVGHQYGSVQLNVLTQTMPDVFSGVVLTGFTFNQSALPLYTMSAAYSSAYDVAPTRFTSSELSPAYLIMLAPQTNQFNFYSYPYYSPTAFATSRANEQPVTQGVLFTWGKFGGPAPDFKGFVYVITGNQDYMFCWNNCYAVPQGSGKTSILEYVGERYPKASSFETLVPENCGNDISAHNVGPEVYQQIQTYLKSKHV